MRIHDKDVRVYLIHSVNYGSMRTPVVYILWCMLFANNAINNSYYFDANFNMPSDVVKLIIIC